ncbi:hypothetical protein BaRGS_00038030, partial [Batillaria attramentaria]
LLDLLAPLIRHPDTMVPFTLEAYSEYESHQFTRQTQQETLQTGKRNTENKMALSITGTEIKIFGRRTDINAKSLLLMAVTPDSQEMLMGMRIEDVGENR